MHVQQSDFVRAPTKSIGAKIIYVRKRFLQYAILVWSTFHVVFAYRVQLLKYTFRNCGVQYLERPVGIRVGGDGLLVYWSCR